jgi:DNA-binding MarR family transcriptional regulator
MPATFDNQEIGRMRGALARIARSIERQAPSEGLTRSQLWILGTVATRGPIGMSELAEIEGMHPSVISRMVGKLEDAGLLERVADSRDARAVLVEVTNAGTELRDRLRTERSQQFAGRLSELPEETAAQLLGVLPALEELAELMNRPPKPEGIPGADS